MSHLDVLLTAEAARYRKAKLRRSVRQRWLADNPMVIVPFQPGGEAHTVTAVGWGDGADDMHLLVVPQPLNRQQLFDGLRPLVEWFLPRFEEAWETAEWDEDFGGYAYGPLPQVICPNPAAISALGRLGRRLAYLPTELSDDPDAPPPAPEDLVRFGRILRWLDGYKVESGQNLVLDAVSLLQFHWVTVQSINERAHLGALLGWIDPPNGLDPDEASNDAERLSIGPYAVPSDEDPTTDLIAAIGEAERAGEPTGELREQLQSLWSDLVAPVWARCWRTLDLLAEELSEDDRFLPARLDRDAKAYARQMEWLDGPTGGRVRTRQTPRQAIGAKRMAEYWHAVVEAQEIVTDPLAMVDQIIAGKAVRGELISVDIDHKVVKPGKTNASSAPLIVLRSDRPCLIPLGRKLWWDRHCQSLSAELRSVTNRVDGTADVELVVIDGVKIAKTDLAPIAGEGEYVCFSAYSTKQFFPGKLPEVDPFTHVEPELRPAHLESAGPVE